MKIIQNYFNLAGRTVLLTGAAGGLGRVFAKALGEAGAELFLAARGEDGLMALAAELEAGGIRCAWHRCDISDDESVEEAVAACITRFGKVDVLVNNGGSNRVNLPPLETSTATYEQVVRTNILGNLSLAKACARDMMKRHWGRIVNIASISGLIVNKGVYGGSYEVTKAALLMMTKTLATEWCREGICVNAIAPGYFGTKPNLNFFAADKAFYGKAMDMIPMERMGKPEELCGALLLLCSDASSYMQGSCIVVDGGYTCW